ncbi:MAG: nucleotidyltransferase family protein, partial [Acidobacteria bacterium]|nr:nucleotidyltransferase family protein [Acidobacteriota bacterium]
MNAVAATVFPRPETELLVCCSRKELLAQHGERIRQILECESLDWAFVLRKASWHGLLPLLTKHLTAKCPDAIPPAIQVELKRLYQNNARRNLNLTVELLKLLREFSSRGIPVIPFKGPVVALALYGDLALRQFIDLDLLIRKSDILKARTALVDYGLIAQFELTEQEELRYFDFRSEHAFSSPNKDLMIDLHCALTPRHFSGALDFERYASRLRPVRLGDSDVRTFSLEDLVLLLCVHGAKDTWERLILVADIAELLQVSGPLNWAAIFEEAEAIGSARMLRTGLLLAQDLLGAQMPDEILPLLQSDPAARSLAAQAARRLL